MYRTVGRHDLIINFCCSECGNDLDIAIAPEITAGALDNTSSDKEYPTGSAYMGGHFHIHPCRNCIDKKIGPAMAIINAIQQINVSKGGK